MSHNFGFGLGVIAVSVIATAVVVDHTIGKQPLSTAAPTQATVAEPAPMTGVSAENPPVIVADSGATVESPPSVALPAIPPTGTEPSKPAPRSTRPPVDPPAPAPAPEPLPEPLNSSPPATAEPSASSNPGSDSQEERKGEPVTTG